MLVATPVWAEWVKVAGNSYAFFYADPETFKKDGKFRRISELQDLKRRNHLSGEMSLRGIVEYDCKETTSRTLSYTSHSGPMATGDIISSSNDPGAWISAPPRQHHENHT
jgi:hypothetical protein